MQFILTGQAAKIMKSGSNARGEWYMYQIKEKNNKSWVVFTNQKLQEFSFYKITGKISESPNKRFKDEADKVAYQATFNGESFELIEQAFDNSEPSINTDEEIPF